MITGKDLDLKADVDLSGPRRPAAGKAEENSEETRPRQAAPRTLEQRLAAARALPIPEDVGCRDCWTRGWSAAMQAVAAAQDPTKAGPTGHERHHPISFTRGRDEAIEAMR